MSLQENSLTQMNLPLANSQEVEKSAPAADKKLRKKIYQVKSFRDLCVSKAICHTKEEIFNHIDKVVKATEAYRNTLSSDILAFAKWSPKIGKEELECSFSLHVIDEQQIPTWEKIFSHSEEIGAKHLQTFVNYVIRKDKEMKEKDVLIEGNIHS